MTENGDATEVDPVSMGVAAAAKSMGDQAGGLMVRLLGPTADVISVWLANKADFRLNNTGRILEIASAKTDPSVAGEIPPRVAYQVLNEGSFVDDELMAEYLGGVLAGSRTPEGRDDRGVSWSSFVNGMSSVEIRAHFLLYRAWWSLLCDQGRELWSDVTRSRVRIYVDQLEFVDALVTDPSMPPSGAITHAMSGLERRGLLLSPIWGGRDYVELKYAHPYDFVLSAVPTLAGIELFGWCLGHAGVDPNSLADLPPFQLDAGLPQLTEVDFESIS